MTKELKVTETEIPGLLIIDLPVHGDNRGWFKGELAARKDGRRRPARLQPGAEQHFVQRFGGYHPRYPRRPWDSTCRLRPPHLRRMVDLRAGESFGKVVTVELGPTPQFVPRGVGNSFQTLEENTAYTYLVNDHWSADAVSGYSFPEPG